MTPKQTLSAAFTTLNNELIAGTIDSAQYLDGFADAIDTDAQAEVVASGYGPRLNTAESNIASLQTSRATDEADIASLKSSRTTDEAQIAANTSAIALLLGKPTSVVSLTGVSSSVLDAMLIGQIGVYNMALSLAATAPANAKKFLCLTFAGTDGLSAAILTNGQSTTAVSFVIWRFE